MLTPLSAQNRQTGNTVHNVWRCYIGCEFIATGLIAVDMSGQFGCFVFVSDFALHFKEPVKNLGTQIEQLSLSLHIWGNLQMQMQTDWPLVPHKNLFVADISGHVKVDSGLPSSSWLHDHAWHVLERLNRPFMTICSALLIIISWAKWLYCFRTHQRRRWAWIFSFEPS